MPKIDISQAPAWVTRLKGRMRTAAKKGLLSAAYRLVGVIQNEVIPQLDPQPVDRGIYRAGWRARKNESGAEVYNGVPHAVFVEEGVRAENVRIGREMIDALTQWVLRKGLGSGGPQKRGAGGRFLKGAAAADARRIAWAIAKSLQKKGIFERGHGFHVMQRIRPRIGPIVEEEVRREIRNMPPDRG